MVAGIFELLHDQYKKDFEEGKKDSYRVGVTLGCTREEEGGRERGQPWGWTTYLRSASAAEGLSCLLHLQSRKYAFICVGRKNFQLLLLLTNPRSWSPLGIQMGLG